MDPKEAVRRVLEALARERRSLGWGRSGSLDRKLGRSEGHVSRLLAGKRGVRLEQLFELVEALDFEPGEFFASVFGAEYRPRPERFLLALERKAETSPLLRRLDVVLARAKAETRTTANEEALEAVRRLEELRFSHPRRVREEGEQLLATLIEETGDVVSLCELLASLGSAERMLNDYPRSAAYLRRALGLARDHGLAGQEADLLQRCCFLIAALGDFGNALAFAAQAAEIYTVLHDLPGVGKCFVDLGIMYTNCGDYERSIAYFESALSYLPRELWRSRITTFHGLGVAYLELGEPETARKYLDRAYKEHKTREGYSWRKMGWLRAEIALVEEDLEDAEASFLTAREFLASQDNTVDVALISLRLSKIYLLTGRLSEMKSTLSDMVEMLQPLRRDNAIAEGVLNDILREALAEKVTEDFLDRSHQRLRHALARSRVTD